LMWLNVLGAIIMNAIASAMLKLASQPPFKLPSNDHPGSFNKLALIVGPRFLLHRLRIICSSCVSADPKYSVSSTYLRRDFSGSHEPINMRTAAGIFFVLVGVAAIAPQS